MRFVVENRAACRLALGLSVAFAIVLTNRNVNASPLGHGSFSGTTVDFVAVTEDSTTDDVSLPGGALFGAPSLVNDTLVFSTPNFAASASGAGGSDTVNGKLTLTINAKPGFFIERIAISEVGDYLLGGFGGAGTAASVFGGLAVTDLTFSTGTFTDPVSVLPKSTFSHATLDFTGTYSGAAEIDFVNDLFLVGITSVSVDFENNLMATSEAFTTSTIKTAFEALQGITVGTAPGPVIPEPSSFLLAAMAVGCGAVRWRAGQRRRKSS